MSVPKSPHKNFWPSPKSEYSFLNWSFFSRDGLCLCEESHWKAFLQIKSLCPSEVWIFYCKESHAFSGFCWVIQTIDFPLTQQITLKRTSFIWVYYLTYDQYNKINLFIHNIYIRLSMDNYINIHCINNILCLSTYLIPCILW